MSVLVSVDYNDGRRETKPVASAAEFRQLLERLPKRARVSLDGGPSREARQWRRSTELWPWSRTSMRTTDPSARISAEPAITNGAEAEMPTPLLIPNAVGIGASTSRDVPSAESVRVEELSKQVQGIRTELSGLTEQITPLPHHVERIDAIVHRLDQDASDLRNEVRRTLQSGLAPVVASLAELTAAVDGRPDKREISALVEQAVAPAAKRIEAELDRVREEYGLLAEEGEEQRRRIRAYRPGTIEELRQRVEELQRDLESRRGDLSKAHLRIDELERENVNLKESTGAVDRAELTRIRDGIAQERAALESTRQLEAERDELRSQVADYKKLEDRYRAAQEAKARDSALEQQVREARDRTTAAENELMACREEVRQLGRRLGHATGSNVDLKNRNELLAEKQESLVAEVDRLTEEMTQMKAALAEAADDKRAAAEERRTLATWRLHEEQALEVRRRELADESRAYRETLDRQHDERMKHADATARAEVAHGLELKLLAAMRERDSASAERDLSKADYERQRAELAKLRREHVDWEAGQHARALELERHENAVEDMNARLDQLRSEQAQCTERLEKGRAEVQTLEERIASLASREQCLRERLGDVDAQYRDELELVRALHAERRRLEEPATRDVRTKSMNQPLPGFSTDSRGRASETLNEAAWLDDVERRILDSEFVFPRRLLEAFHTSLKITHWSPLTVLAGMSGTGKSALARLYAHFGGLRFHMVPVQPNWDSPQDLFGFFNHIDGLYKATPLLRALVQSQRSPRDGGFEDGLLLIGLDEMNLARVEYYGSELLSRWESRRDGAEAEALQLDIGHGEHEAVQLGTNVMWVGTMNEDETTLSLSDKVLERGNVITFPRPKSLKRRERVGLGEAAPWLAARTFARWTVEPSALPEGVRARLKGSLEELNYQLGLVHRSVSHRTLQAIENYVANHPRVRSQAAGDETDEHWKRAFADQLVQRVIPKLRGLDNQTGRHRECLEGIARLLSRDAEELVQDFGEARKSQQFLWASANYLERADGRD